MLILIFSKLKIYKESGKSEKSGSEKAAPDDTDWISFLRRGFV